MTTTEHEQEVKAVQADAPKGARFALEIFGCLSYQMTIEELRSELRSELREDMEGETVLVFDLIAGTREEVWV